MALDDDLAAFASAQNFAALTTLGPDGMPSTHIMWVDTDGEHILINTEVHRQKYKNVLRDGRVAVTIWNRENQYSYVEARGRVEETVAGTFARDQMDRISTKYTGAPYEKPVVSERVVLKIAVERVHKHRVPNNTPT